jgi:hypothetical protein
MSSAAAKGSLPQEGSATSNVSEWRSGLQKGSSRRRTERPSEMKELRNHVGTVIGKFAAPANIVFTPELPKTRSGKIMRRLLRDVSENRPLGAATPARILPPGLHSPSQSVLPTLPGHQLHMTQSRHRFSRRPNPTVSMSNSIRPSCQVSAARARSTGRFWLAFHLIRGLVPGSGSNFPQ